MPKSKRIPEFKSYEEMGEFWDTHSLADYWDQTEPAEFEISEQVRRRYVVRIDRDDDRLVPIRVPPAAGHEWQGGDGK